MIEQTCLFTISALFGIMVACYHWLGGFGRKIHHPPSPKSLPFIGNVFSIPPGLDYLSFLEIGKRLKSDIFYLNMMGTPLLILNSARAASDLLEKHSAIYSDRVGIPMVSDPALLDWSAFAGLLPYNDDWRRQIRRMKNWLSPRAVRQFDSLHQDEAKLLLKRLLDTSASCQPFEQHKSWSPRDSATGSVALRLAYGYRPKNDQDPFYVDAVEASHNLFKATMMSNFLVNAFPALSYVPDWFPGTSWKNTARSWRNQKNRAVDTPYQWTKQQVATGDFEPSVLSALLQDHNMDPDTSVAERDKDLKELAYALFVGGTDTLATALVNFVTAMVSYPDTQAKAQSEIDALLGYATRLPELSDEPQLPYVRSLILEVLRWLPVGPTGGPPHACSEDNVYRGYDIERGTIIVGNLWAMSRDEAVYENPDCFEPERFLDPNTPPLPGFGWGRRKCVGIHFAETSLFFMISSLLATFTFSQKKDKDGKDVRPVVKGAYNHLALTLEPFEFEFQPRSERHRQLILENIPSQ